MPLGSGSLAVCMGVRACVRRMRLGPSNTLVVGVVVPVLMVARGVAAMTCRRIPETWVVSILHQLASGMEVLHSAGFCHLDISLENATFEAKTGTYSTHVSAVVVVADDDNDDDDDDADDDDNDEDDDDDDDDRKQNL